MVKICRKLIDRTTPCNVKSCGLDIDVAELLCVIQGAPTKAEDDVDDAKARCCVRVLS